jgi:hypothetical protein
MKKIYTLFVAVLVSTAAFATEPGDGSRTTGLAVMKKGENTFNLYYQPASVTDVKVYIRDSKGKEVFSEHVKKTDGFIRPYTFSNLEIGEYTVTVVDGEDTFTKKFMYGVTESKKLARVARLEDGKYLVAIPASFYQGAADVKIYAGDVLAHTERITASGDYSQIFNVKKLTGEISFEVSDSKGNKIN